MILNIFGQSKSGPINPKDQVRVKFHHGKLNFKWSGGGSEIKWHQDIPFWPHTAYNVLTIGVALENINNEMGPMGVLPGSHKGPIYDHYDMQGNWLSLIHI